MADERDPFLPLRRDVGELGRLLGETLVEQEGPELLELEEAIRALAKQRRRGARGGRCAAEGHLRAAVEAQGTADAANVARAFTHYFQLVNLAEQHHRVRRLRARAREGAPAPGSFDHEVAALAAEVPRARLEEELARTRLTLVFTAHPSEAQRRTVLGKHRRIAELLAKRGRGGLTPLEEEDVELALREEIALLWQTDEVRALRPRVADEVKSTLFYLEEILFPLVPRFYASLERAARRGWGADVRVAGEAWVDMIDRSCASARGSARTWTATRT